MAKRNLFFLRPGFLVSAALTLLALVLGFGLIGISVAGESELYRRHVWVPAALSAASGLLMAGILTRWARRAWSAPRRR
jgi:hypothetical protein